MGRLAYRGYAPAKCGSKCGNVRLEVRAGAVLATAYTKENSREIQKNETSIKGNGKTTKYKANKSPKHPQVIDWIESDEYREWIISSPSLKDIDLMPYYTACREKTDFLSGNNSDETIREIIGILMKDEAILAGETDRIKALSEENAMKVFDII